MTRKLDATTTAEEVVEGMDLSAWSALVTGASGGLGAETAAALGRRGARVTLAARNVDRVEQVAERIREENPAARIDTVELELGSPRSVIDCAQEVTKRHHRLDALINNRPKAKPNKN